ncbi:hypothetical protein [Pontibacter sp. BAB1700]|nr:hypothetical protein [Pontibacter sp. BAB1700]
MRQTLIADHNATASAHTPHPRAGVIYRLFLHIHQVPFSFLG